MKNSKRTEQNSVSGGSVDKAPKAKKSALLRNIGILALVPLIFLSGCIGDGIVQTNPATTLSPVSDLSTVEPTFTQTATKTPTIPPTVTSTPTLTPTEIQKEIVEWNEKFDMESIDLKNWETFEVIEDELIPNGEVLTTQFPTKAFILPSYIPVNIYDTFHHELTMIENTTFEIGQIKTVQNDKGEEVTIGIVSKVITDKTYINTIALIMSAKDSQGEEQKFMEVDNTTPDTATYIMTETWSTNKEFLGNYNTLLRLAEFQESNGPFQEGEVYSFLDICKSITELKELNYYDEYYKMWMFYGGKEIPTILSLLSIGETPSLEVIEKRKPTEEIIPNQLLLQERDWRAITGIDNLDNPTTQYDFKFRPRQNGYFQIQPIVTDFGPNVSIPGLGGLRPAKVLHGFTISFVEKKPENQPELIQEILDSYQDYFNWKTESIHYGVLSYQRHRITEYNIAQMMEKVFPYADIEELYNSMFDISK